MGREEHLPHRIVASKRLVGVLGASSSCSLERHVCLSALLPVALSLLHALPSQGCDDGLGMLHGCLVQRYPDPLLRCTDAIRP